MARRAGEPTLLVPQSLNNARVEVVGNKFWVEMAGRCSRSGQMGERRQRLDMNNEYSMVSRPSERTAFLSLQSISMDFNKHMHVFLAVCSYTSTLSLWFGILCLSVLCHDVLSCVLPTNLVNPWAMALLLLQTREHPVLSLIYRIPVASIFLDGHQERQLCFH